MMDIKRGGKQVKDSMFNYGKDTCVSNSMAHTGVLSIRHKDIPLTYKRRNIGMTGLKSSD